MKVNVELAAESSGRFISWLKTATITPVVQSGRLPAVLGIAGILFVAAMSGNVFAAQKVCDDGSRPPCRDTGEVAGNRLSYPAIRPGGDSIIPPFFDVKEDGYTEGEETAGLGYTWSYGCDKPETTDDEQYSYPNTSCVDSLDSPVSYYAYDECTAKCDDLPLYRIYWQKEAFNNWSAQVTGSADTDITLPIKVRFVDWGDSIESVSWSETSILRVETQPFADLSQDSLAPDSEEPTTLLETQPGFQMWHVSGQGITEQWGVRFDEDTYLPYVYQSPYAIINAGTADLYLSKLFVQDADDDVYGCPASSGDAPPAYPVGYFPDGYPDDPEARWITFEDITFTEGVINFDAEIGGWLNTCNLAPVDFTVEQSVSGKFVHGYNWRMRDLPNPLGPADCPTYEKTGWWRLTFVPNGGAVNMVFDAEALTIAPDLPLAVPTDLALLAEAEEETTGTLYTPVVLDTTDQGNLTYIDICIVKKAKGGGKK